MTAEYSTTSSLWCTGPYRTRDGRRALVRGQDTNLLGEPCWHGTVRGIGWTTWDNEGKHIDGRTELDLLMPALGVECQ